MTQGGLPDHQSRDHMGFRIIRPGDVQTSGEDSYVSIFGENSKEDLVIEALYSNIGSMIRRLLVTRRTDSLNAQSDMVNLIYVNHLSRNLINYLFTKIVRRTSI